MSVSGIVLITVCLGNALTIQAHYCPCTYNSEPFAPEKYYESLLPYEDSYSSFPSNYQSHKQEPLQQSFISSFPQQFHRNTVEWLKRPEVPKTSNEAKQPVKLVKENPAYDVMSQAMIIAKEQPKIKTKIGTENASASLERLEEKDDRIQYSVQERITEGSPATEHKIISYNNQQHHPSLLVPYVQQFHTPSVMGPDRLEMFKPSNEEREQKITEKEKPTSEAPKQLLNKKSKKHSEMGPENNAVISRRTQDNKGRITHGGEEKRIEESSGHDQKEIYESESRPYEISNTAEKLSSQIIIQRSPPSHFNYFSPNFMGVEIL